MLWPLHNVMQDFERLLDIVIKHLAMQSVFSARLFDRLWTRFLQFYFVLAVLSNAGLFKRPMKILSVDLVHSLCHAIIEKF